MTSDQLLERLLALHPKEIDLSLDRLTRLLADLGHPEQNLPPIIHVAGTNGKGSTIALLRAALEAAGKSVHVYTSPHLVHFHERIRLAGTLIDEGALKQVLDEVESANAGQDITFFEATTAAAFLAFSRTPADALLLEVGLGGRLDATNVIPDPVVTVITPVAMDHERFLGTTLSAIAAEKAGILKPGVPAVIAPQHPKAQAVIRDIATKVGAPLTEITGADTSTAPDTNLLGAHQRTNAAVASAALHQSGWVTDADIATGFTQADWPARMQRLAAGPLTDPLGSDAEVWLDGGHNPQAGTIVAEFLSAKNVEKPRPLHMIIGMLDTKASDGFLAALAALQPTTWTVTIPDAPASRTAEDVASIAHQQGLTATACASVEDAIAQIDPQTAPRILIVGSLYLAGIVLKRNNQSPT